ncbi:hypothetical protein K431DRAFT_164890 [Polychaeton citri CBS 116435]|uniref:Uncharacterized protein n=1 Tax=Polychaeton citri CBS 116435 TaxID=1314669 RepID=A0A9P4QCV1_9PEZI|nr:hypothetical protein K431DRAFT_164890 [Polychaeton citri CBS 116435]
MGHARILDAWCFLRATHCRICHAESLSLRTSGLRDGNQRTDGDCCMLSLTEMICRSDLDLGAVESRWSSAVKWPTPPTPPLGTSDDHLRCSGSLLITTPVAMMLPNPLQAKKGQFKPGQHVKIRLVHMCAEAVSLCWPGWVQRGTQRVALAFAVNFVVLVAS